MNTDKKPRSDKKLEALSEDQADQLYLLMRVPGASLVDVKKIVLEKFSLDVSTRALSKFWREYTEQLNRERILRSARNADQFGAKLAERVPDIAKALKAQLMHIAFDAGMQGVDIKTIETIMNIVGGMDQAELTKARIALDMEKFRESLKTQQEKALDALFVDIRGNQEAEQLFFKFRDVVRGAAEAAV